MSEYYSAGSTYGTQIEIHPLTGDSEYVASIEVSAFTEGSGSASPSAQKMLTEEQVSDIVETLQTITSQSE